MLQPIHAGILLTGGASSRMGRDKATIQIGGATLAERAASVLRAAAAPVVAVGPEAGSGLAHVDDPRIGPLVAIDKGLKALLVQRCVGPVIVLACDMPLITADLLLDIASRRRGADAVVPIAGGRLQPLCAAYGPNGRAAISKAVATGKRSMREALAMMKIEIVPVDDEGAFVDLDTPHDLEAVSAILAGPA